MQNRRWTTVLLWAIILGASGCAQPLTEEQIIARAEAVHARAVTLDSHVDITGPYYATEELDPGTDHPKLKCDLVKMRRGGMDGVFLAVYVRQRPQLDAQGYEKAQEIARQKFDAIRRLTDAMYPDRCELATSADDVQRIVETGKKAIIIGMENGYPIGQDLSLLKRYYDLGARYITLCHTGHNQICDSSGPKKPLHNGLSQFGKKVIARMNRLGIICDASHISEKSFFDLIEVTKAPIIASHSGCHALHPHNRNLTDEQLKALKKNGGVIQVVTVDSFLKAETPQRKEAVEQLRKEFNLPTQQQRREMSAEQLEALRPKLDEYFDRYIEISARFPVAALADYVDHIDHAVKTAGIDHVGIGTDFDGGGGVVGFNNHAEALNVTVELVRRGYSNEDIVKIWGGNLLRVWRQVEKAAAKLQRQDQ